MRIAARLASDPARLARERSTLRTRLLASPIGDARAYTRAVEAAYRDLWRRWCEKAPLRLLTSFPRKLGTPQDRPDS